MAISVRPISHHDELSVFAHLGELRGRLIVSVSVLAIAFAFAFWQNHALLQVLNRPLANVASPSLTDSSAPLSATTGTQQKLRAAIDSQRVAFGLLASSAGPLTLTQRQALASAAHADADYLAATPAPPAGIRPVTLGIGEPFSQTVIVSAYFALLLALPGDPVAAIRVHHPRVHASRTASGDAPAHAGAAAVRPRARVRILRRATGSRHLPAALQRGLV